MIVDNEPMVRRGLQMSLNLEEDMRVVGEASSGETAVQVARLVEPDVVIMDIEMPAMNGFEAAKAILLEEHAPRVIMLSLHDDVEMREKARSAGVAAFIAKHAPFENLLRAIRQHAAADHEDR